MFQAPTRHQTWYFQMSRDKLLRRRDKRTSIYKPLNKPLLCDHILYTSVFVVFAFLRFFFLVFFFFFVFFFFVFSGPPPQIVNSGRGPRKGCFSSSSQCQSYMFWVQPIQEGYSRGALKGFVFFIVLISKIHFSSPDNSGYIMKESVGTTFSSSHCRSFSLALALLLALAMPLMLIPALARVFMLLPISLCFCLSASASFVPVCKWFLCLISMMKVSERKPIPSTWHICLWMIVVSCHFPTW